MTAIGAEGKPRTRVASRDLGCAHTLRNVQPHPSKAENIEAI